VFLWRYRDANDIDVGNSDLFEDQETAEAWLSAEWEPLSKSGVVEVLLFDEDAGVIVYRMSLAPDEP
jgi:hypothetical protein